MTRLPSDKIIGAIILAVGIAASLLSLQVGSQMWGGESARLFPLVISITLVALGGVLIWTGTESLGLGHEAGQVLFLSVVGVTYILLISKLGYLIATAIAAPFGFWIFGVRSRLGLLLGALLCPLVFHLIFFVGLGVFPPYGDWFDLLDLIQGY